MPLDLSFETNCLKKRKIGRPQPKSASSALKCISSSTPRDAWESLGSRLHWTGSPLQFVFLRVEHIQYKAHNSKRHGVDRGCKYPIEYSLCKQRAPSRSGAYKSASRPRLPMTDPTSARTCAITGPEEAALLEMLWLPK